MRIRLSRDPLPYWYASFVDHPKLDIKITTDLNSRIGSDLQTKTYTKRDRIQPKTNSFSPMFRLKSASSMKATVLAKLPQLLVSQLLLLHYVSLRYWLITENREPKNNNSCRLTQTQLITPNQIYKYWQQNKNY